MPRGRPRPVPGYRIEAPAGFARGCRNGRVLRTMRGTSVGPPRSPHLRLHEKALADVGGPTGLPQRVKLRNRCRGAMDSQEILALALHLANQSEVPADTTINVPARDVRKVLFGIDVDAADLLFAKENGYDLVIAHHPTGGSAVLGLPKVFAKHASILTGHGV
ncbi:MAG: hypothetical protein E6J99_04430, partial [Methanobacteriota archaeon]